MPPARTRRRGGPLASATPDVARTPGRYVTDGRRLFRLVEPFDHPVRGGIVGLEDCRSLEVVLVPTDEFLERGLWSVRTPPDRRT